MMKVASSQKIEELIERSASPANSIFNAVISQNIRRQSNEEVKIPDEELKQQESPSQN